MVRPWQVEGARCRRAVTHGTGNVFADLGFPDAAERQAKLRLAYGLIQALEQRKVSRLETSRVLGVTPSKVSALRHYRLAGFSINHLTNLLTAVEQGGRGRARTKTEFSRGARK